MLAGYELNHDILNNDVIPFAGKEMLHIHYTCKVGGTMAPDPTINPVVSPEQIDEAIIP
jgi:hypothetical protein